MNIIAHNLLAMNAQRQLGIRSNCKLKTTEKLSSGYKINRAADDAAGLSISEKMRRQIRGLEQGSRNIQDGICFVQVAEGALNEVHDILQRMNELSVKAANGTNTDSDRMYIQQEMSHLSEECDRIFKETEFNEQKIWEAPYIPYVTGIPRELKIYNDTMDSQGNIKFGGIIWGAKRYRWDEIDANMYDAGTGKFNPGTYQMDVPAVILDTSSDRYVENGNTVTLNLTVSEEGLLTSIERECSWSANENGITMDGVLYGWDKLEDSSHNKSFDPHNIETGTWGMNTYHGTHVWFEIPEEAKDLSDVIDGINGTILDNLSWITQADTIQTTFSVGVVYGSQAAIFDAPELRVTNATKNLVSDKYYLHADENGVWAVNKSGTSLGKETWRQLGWENSLGEFLPAHESTNHLYYSYTEPDNHAAVTGGYWHYTEGSEGYNSSRIPGLDVQFLLLEEASKQGVINGIDGVVIPAGFSTPSVATGTVQNASNKVTLDNSHATLSFDFHHAMGRDFNNPSAFLGAGVISYDTNNPNAEITLEINNGGKLAKFVAKNGSKKDSVADIKSRVESLLKGNGGILSLKFEDDSGNMVALNYKISPLTDDEKKEILASGGNKTVEDYSRDVVAAVLSTTVSLEASAYAKQTLGQELHSLSALGWADTQNNKASYVDFSTKINYTRELKIQAGPEVGQQIKIQYDVLNAAILGLVNVSVHDESSAGAGIHIIKKAMETVSIQRSIFGAYQNRLEHAVQINDNTAENTTAAESLIRDADMEQEIVKDSVHSILLQAEQAVLSQANQSSRGVLNLLE